MKTAIVAHTFNGVRCGRERPADRKLPLVPDREGAPLPAAYFGAISELALALPCSSVPRSSTGDPAAVELEVSGAAVAAAPTSTSTLKLLSIASWCRAARLRCALLTRADARGPPDRALAAPADATAGNGSLPMACGE